MTAAAVIRELEASGVELRLDGDRVRWRGRVTRELLEAARAHRDALIHYLRRRCEECGNARTVMVLMETTGSTWWLCALCWRAGKR